jgi:hypothetical protein
LPLPHFLPRLAVAPPQIGAARVGSSPNLLPPEIPIRPAMIIVHAHIFDDVPVL